MALPKIRIGVFEVGWHGAACLRAAPNIHYATEAVKEKT